MLHQIMPKLSKPIKNPGLQPRVSTLFRKHAARNEHVGDLKSIEEDSITKEEQN